MPSENVSEFVELVARVFGVAANTVMQQLRKAFNIWIRLFGFTVIAFIGFAAIRTGATLSGTESVIGMAGLMMAGTAIVAAILLVPGVFLWRVLLKDDYRRATGNYFRDVATVIVWILISTLGAVILAPVLQGSPRYTTIYVLSAIIVGLLWMINREPKTPRPAPISASTQAATKSGSGLGTLLVLAVIGGVGYLISLPIREAWEQDQTRRRAETEEQKKITALDNASCPGEPAEITFYPGLSEKVVYTMKSDCWSPWFNAESFNKYYANGVDNKGFYIRFYDGFTAWVPPYDGTNCVWFSSPGAAPSAQARPLFCSHTRHI